MHFCVKWVWFGEKSSPEIKIFDVLFCIILQKLPLLRRFLTKINFYFSFFETSDAFLSWNVYDLMKSGDCMIDQCIKNEMNCFNHVVLVYIIKIKCQIN